MIAQVAQGIMAKFTGSALSTLVGGRIWRDSAKQNETMPYIVFQCIDTQNCDTFSEFCEFQHWIFYIWADLANTGYAGLDAIETALRSLFDYATLTTTGWNNTGFKFGNANPSISEDDNVIGVMVDYEIYISKARV
jgi:hypothetical protein